MIIKRKNLFPVYVNTLPIVFFMHCTAMKYLKLILKKRKTLKTLKTIKSLQCFTGLPVIEKTPTKREPGFFPVFYHYAYRSSNYSRTHTNIIGLIDWSTRNNKLNRFLFLPFVMYRPNRFFAIPILFFSKWKGGVFFLGAYITKSRQNFLWLLDHKKRSNYEYYNAIFGAFHYGDSYSRVRWWLLYRLLAGYSGKKNSRDYNFNVLMYVQSRKGDNFHSSCLPLWWYDSEPNRTTVIIPPLLTYSRVSKSDTFQMFGGGLLWYRNYEGYSHKGRNMVGLGILYNQVYRPKRGLCFLRLHVGTSLGISKRESDRLSQVFNIKNNLQQNSQPGENLLPDFRG